LTRIALVQTPSRLGDVQHNKETHLAAIRGLQPSGVHIIAFPELSLTGYLLKDLAYEVAPACRAAELEIQSLLPPEQVAIVGTVGEGQRGIIHNTAAVIRAGQPIVHVPKLYLPTYGLFEESRYFTPGRATSLTQTFTSSGLRFGIVICEDAWHPEPIELLARSGADLVICIASSPTRGVGMKRAAADLSIGDKWLALLRAHALMNSVFVAFVNRTGSEDDEFFWGGSMLMGPSGQLIASAQLDSPETLIVSVDADLVGRARRMGSYKDHRVDVHDLLGKL
jgi:predicted amidohydrolase